MQDLIYKTGRFVVVIACPILLNGCRSFDTQNTAARPWDSPPTKISEASWRTYMSPKAYDYDSFFPRDKFDEHLDSEDWKDSHYP